MKLCSADCSLHRISVSIAIGLVNSFLSQFFHAVFGIFILGILQFHNVAVLHVGGYPVADRGKYRT